MTSEAPARQLVMPLPVRTASGRDDLMVTAANADAVALVDGWRTWPDGRLALIGPEGAGKSHIVRIWAEEARARVLPAGGLRAEAAPALAEGPVALEDADRAMERGVDEAALFHLWNACARSGAPLLLTGRAPPADWPVRLPDLASRLRSLTPARIGTPDDALLSVLLVKLFADRQIAVRPALIGWLLRRMERSHAAALRTVEALDREALARGAPVDIALARDLFDTPSADPPPP